MALIVTYGPTTIHNAEIARCEQEVVYDPSGTDALFVRTTLTIRGHVFRGEVKDTTRPQVFPPGNAELTPVNVTHALSQPRLPLDIVRQIQGQQPETLWHVIPCTFDDGGLGAPMNTPERRAHQDVENGPRPTGVAILQNYRWGFEVEWTVTFSQVPLDRDGYVIPDQPVAEWALNNRWRITEQMDENFFMTKTYSGSIRLRTAHPTLHMVARLLAFPELEPGFKRESCEYTVSENGLEVTYRIVDRQVAHAPPWPATRMEVRHSESLTKMGYAVQSACTVRLWGPPSVPKAALLARVAQILRNRLLWDGGLGKSAFVESLRITDEIGPENCVTGEMIINRFPLVADNAAPAGNDQDAKGGDGRGVAGGQAAPAGNPPAVAQAAGWLQKVVRNVLGTDIVLPPLQGAWINQLNGILGHDTQHPDKSIKPMPWGYKNQAQARGPVEEIFFTCYYQRSYCPPHRFHPWLGTEPGDVPDAAMQDAIRGVNAAPPGEKWPQDNPVQAAAPPAEPQRVAEIVDQALPEAVSLSHAQALYTFATAQNDYQFHRGRVALARSLVDEYDPLVNDDGEADAVIITLNRPLYFRHLHYEAERIGDWPEIPTPADYQLPGGAEAKLMEFHIKPQPPALTADGQHLVYRVEAYYQWAYTRALPGQYFDTGTLPHVRSDLVSPFGLGTHARDRLLLLPNTQSGGYAWT